MNDLKLTDIAEICETYGVTSRTLRFYEEEGIIKSTREEGSARRKYSTLQITKIREVLTLRAIGISVKEIKDYLEGNMSLKEIVHLRKAEIIASIEGKMREIDLLNDTLMAIDDGEDILAPDESEAKSKCRGKPRLKKTEGLSVEDDRKNEVSQAVAREREENALRVNIVRECADAIVHGDLGKVYPHFSRQMQEYMPEEAFQAMWRDCITGAGAFLRIGKTTVSSDSANVIFLICEFENLKIQIKFVFRKLVIHGLWTSFVE